MFGHIARALDLTEDQKTLVREVLRAHASEIKAQMKAGGEARRALHEAILAEPIDESAIRARAADLAHIEGDGAVLFARLRAEVFPILTDEQKERIQRFHERMRERGDRAGQAFDDFVNGEGP